MSSKARLLALIASLACVAVIARGQDEIVDVIYEINNPPVIVGGYSIVQDEGVAVAQEDTIDFVGAGVTATAGVGKTTVTIPGGAGSVATDAIWDAAGDLAVGTGADTAARLAKGANGTILTMTAGAVGWAAPAAAAGSVTLQGAYPGTPDAGHANLTGTYGSTQNNIHATISNFGLSLENNQAALVGQQQEYSPGIRFLGAAWDVDGAVSNTNVWQLFARPVAGNTTTVDLSFQASIAGGAYAQKAYLDSNGKLTLGESGTSVGELRLYNATSGGITITPTTGALGTVTLTAPAVSGTILQSGTDVTLAQIVPSSAASKILGRGSAAGAGDFQEITLGTNLSMSGTTLNVTAATCDPTTAVCPTFDEYSCGASSSATRVGTCKGLENITNTNSGTAGVKTGDGTWGVGYLSTAATTNGISCYNANSLNSTHLLDTAYWQGRFQLSALSTTTEEYTVYVGSGDGVVNTATMPVDGVYFSYHNTTAAATPNWMINTVSNTTATTADSGVAVAATTWYTLKYSYESGVGVHFYINGVETANSPINTNLPTASGREYSSWQYKIFKQAGSGTPTAAELWMDYDVFGVTSLTR